MAKERRDSKNRILGRGEYQKEDGRYMYRYTDINGKTRFVYSWTLTKTDRLPKGKTAGPCLRDLEKEIAKDIQDGIDSFSAKNITVNEYFEKYIGQKKKIKPTTKCLYRRNYDVYLKERIGSKIISTITYSDVLRCYNNIIEECHLSVATMVTIDAVLKPLLRMAVRDNLLRNNPADGVLSDIAKEYDDRSSKKSALTVKQQNAFLDFVTNSRIYSKWLTMFTVMLGTGCRIGEICGLTWDDCDFSENVIHVKRTMCYTPDENTGKCRLTLQEPKSSSGFRSIPMLSDVREALQNERVRQLREGFCETVIGDISGFVFCNRDKKALIPNNTNKVLERIVNVYNKYETELAIEEDRPALLLPKISPHILRHSFCTRLCESGMNIKVVQDVMGHSKITMTMDVYNSCTKDFKEASFGDIDGMFRIG